MFGIHTATSGERLPLVANVVDTCKNKMYEKLISIPKPMCKPIPPLVFLLAILTPIKVKIKVAKGMDVLLYFLIQKTQFHLNHAFFLQQ